MCFLDYAFQKDTLSEKYRFQAKLAQSRQNGRLPVGATILFQNTDGRKAQVADLQRFIRGELPDLSVFLLSSKSVLATSPITNFDIKESSILFFGLLSALLIGSNASASERIIHCVREGSGFNKIADLTLHMTESSGTATVARMNPHVPEAEARLEVTHIRPAYLENGDTWREVFHWGEITSIASALGKEITEEVVLVRSEHHTGALWTLRKIRISRSPAALCIPYVESGCEETSAIVQDEQLSCTDGQI